MLILADWQRLGAALAQFHQGTGFGRRRTGLRAAAEQVSRAQIAAIDGVVCHQLRDAPVGVLKTGFRQPLRRLA